MNLLSSLTSPLPTAEQMRQWDAKSLDYGISQSMLMENASRAALHVLQKITGSFRGKYILLFMGSGNNGGDAACLARHLQDLQAFPLVLHTKKLEDYNDPAKEHIHIATACQVPFKLLPDSLSDSLPGNWQSVLPSPWNKAQIIVDGLLGTGFEGSLRPQFIDYINYINSQRSQSFIYALDIPSGYPSDYSVHQSTEILAVKAHATICFAAAKPSLVLPKAQEFTGDLFVHPIGIPHQVQEKYKPSYRLIQEKDLGCLLNPKSPHCNTTIIQFNKHVQSKESHKNFWGHVLVLGGSQGLTGAAHLSALAALHTGAGLVTIGAPYGLCSEIKANNPNIMTLPLNISILGTSETQNPHQSLWPETLPSNLVQKISAVHTIAIGPGMGTDDNALAFLFALLKHKNRPRTVFDADALTLLARHKDLLNYLREDDILTPHPGEAARFLNNDSKDIQANRFKAIAQLSTLAPCAWLLKGAGTLIKNSKSPTYILPHDILALAIAGSGDVLTGCVATCLARYNNIDSITLLALGASLHALAGKLAQEAFPWRGHLASDLASLLPCAMQKMCAKQDDEYEYFKPLI